jgi:hypothetical protein
MPHYVVNPIDFLYASTKPELFTGGNDDPKVAVIKVRMNRSEASTVTA